jgi:predicted HTH domain antitoxin
MEKIEIDIPDELAGQLKPYHGRLQDVLVLGLRQVKIDEALALYDRGLISFGRAVELAGVRREELVREARMAGVRSRWTEDTVREELA